VLPRSPRPLALLGAGHLCLQMTAPSSSVVVALHDAQAGHGHRFGINAFASSADGELFTAGRDGTVRCWGLSGSAVYTLDDEHTDWVNDIVLLKRGLLASCSSDRTIRLWSLPASGSGPTCEVIGSHDDYAKSLAYASEGELLLSAGFDCRLLIWDVQRFSAARYSPVAASEGGHRCVCACARKRETTARHTPGPVMHSARCTLHGARVPVGRMGPARSLASLALKRFSPPLSSATPSPTAQ
jgi:hypothetical protein